MNLSTHHRPAESCPAPERLRAWALGEVDEAGQEALAAHVESCELCRAALEAMEAGEELASSSTHDEYATRRNEQDLSDPQAAQPGDSATRSSAEPAAPPLAETYARAGTTPADDAPQVFRQFPTRFGRYEVRRCLGKGGMGEVYLAWDTKLGRTVALKVPTGSSRQRSLRRFLREARAAAALDHPNICPIYDHGELDGVYYLTLKYIDGRTLAETLEDGPLPIPDAVELCRKLAEALEAAHRAGVVHRDLKPSNIMLDQAGQPYIMDFGLAQRETDELLLTRSGDILGTPAYMSPEQARGENDQVSARSDVYSLGAVLYQTLTGRLPFTGNFTQVLAKVLQDDPPPPSHHRPEIDPRLDAICQKAMAKRPADRYATAKEFSAALGEYPQANDFEVQSNESDSKYCAPGRMKVALAVIGKIEADKASRLKAIGRRKMAMAVIATLLLAATTTIYIGFAASSRNQAASAVTGMDGVVSAPNVAATRVSTIPTDQSPVDEGLIQSSLRKSGQETDDGGKLATAIRELAENISKYMKEDAQASELSLGAFTAAQPELGASAGASIKKLLAEELTTMGLTVQLGARFSCKGEFTFFSNGANPGKVAIEAVLREKNIKRKTFTTEIFDVSDVAAIMGPAR